MEHSMKMIAMALAAATLTLSACGGTDSVGNNTSDVTNVTEVTNTATVDNTTGAEKRGGENRPFYLPITDRYAHKNRNLISLQMLITISIIP
jgi:hypothetical protein